MIILLVGVISSIFLVFIGTMNALTADTVFKEISGGIMASAGWISCMILGGVSQFQGVRTDLEKANKNLDHIMTHLAHIQQNTKSTADFFDGKNVKFEHRD